MRFFLTLILIDKHSQSGNQDFSYVDELSQHLPLQIAYINMNIA